jgi:YVTN family beta-propeller protein
MARNGEDGLATETQSHGDRKVAMRLRSSIRWGLVVGFFLLATAGLAMAQTPSPALLVLEKSDSSLAIVDPATLKIVARVPAGPDPHEIEASPDGKFAYISNYGGLDSTNNTISVVDVVARKALTPISLGALRSPHGLAIAGGKLYFTAETSKVFGRYDPASQKIDWVLGTGQDRTHMVIVSSGLDRVFTSNVTSGTISIIEQVDVPMPPGPPPGAPAGAGPPPGGPRKTWEVTSVPSGHGSEGFDVSPDGREIWAANAGDGTVTVIDVASKKATATFPVAVHGNRLKFTPDGKRVLISGGGFFGGSLNFEVVDVATRKEIKQLDMGGGSGGVLIVPDGSRAFVAVSGKNKVVAVDLKTLEVSGELATGKNPDGLAWAVAR